MTDLREPRIVRRAGVVALGLMLVATVVAAAQPPAPHDRSWFDSPLTGSEVPFGTIEVVGHATATGGVGHIELSANGQTVAATDVRDTPVLATVRLAWTPRSPGAYLLVLRARDTAGVWGAPASVIVVVGDAVDETPAPSTSTSPSASTSPSTDPVDGTPVPATTPAPTANPGPTPRPTPTACLKPTPTLTNPPDRTVITAPADNPPQLRWTFRSATCPVVSFGVQVSYDPEFRALVVDVSVPGDAFEWQRRLAYDDCTTVHWRVRPTWSSGAGAWSAVSRFAIAIGGC